jgi:magnesium transporter
MITFYHSSARARKLAVVSEPRVGSWCHVVGPSDAELDQVADLFGLDRDILSDATDIYEAPRVDVDPDTKTAYVFTRYCHPQGQDVATEPLLIIYTANHTITIMRKADGVLDQILQGRVEVLTTQKTKTFLHILEQINRSYRLHLTYVSKEVLRMRSRLRQSEISNLEFVSFIELEEDLNEFLTALQPQAAVLTSLKTGRYMKLYEDDRDLIEDLTLNTTELIELTKSRLRTVVNIRQAYDTIATNNLQQIFKRLTSIGIFLAIPTVIGGLFGMNVALPFQKNPYAFVFVLAIMAVLIASTVYTFRKRKWL